MTRKQQNRWSKIPDNEKGDRLIKDLQNAPERFIKNGQGIGLLNELYHGFPKEKLIPLLCSDNLSVCREALAVIDELGTGGADLLDNIIPLLNSEDGETACLAAEIVLNCGNIDEYLAVFNSRNCAASAILHMSEKYLCWVRKYFEENGESSHVQGISALLGEISVGEITESGDPILQKYKAIMEFCK